MPVLHLPARQVRLRPGPVAALERQADLLVRRWLKLSEGGVFRYCVRMIVRNSRGHIRWEALFFAIIDDDEALRSSLADLMRSMGYRTESLPRLRRS